MLAVTIIRHSISLVIRNWREALVLSVIPLLLMTAATLLQLRMFNSFTAGSPGVGNGPGQLDMLAIFAMTLLMSFGTIWAAVSWHRYILLEERPVVLAPLRAGRVLSYFGHSLLISLALAVVALPMVLLFPALINLGPPNQTKLSLISLVLGLPLVTIGLRLSTGLPGAALAEPKPLSTAWQATRGQIGTFILLALIGLIAQQALNQLLLALVQPGFPNISLVALLPMLIGDWISIFVAISVLTTVYGHFVQGRDLR